MTAFRREIWSQELAVYYLQILFPQRAGKLNGNYNVHQTMLARYRGRQFLVRGEDIRYLVFVFVFSRRPA